jgi:hypothetical protein
MESVDGSRGAYRPVSASVVCASQVRYCDCILWPRDEQLGAGVLVEDKRPGPTWDIHLPGQQPRK